MLSFRTPVWSNVLASWVNNEETGCGYWDQNTLCPINLLQLSQGALPLLSDHRTKLFNWQEMEGPSTPPLLPRIRWEREGLCWSWEWRDPVWWILKEGMHENRGEREIEKATLMGYSPFKDLSLNHPLEVWYRGINPSRDRSRLWFYDPPGL